MMVGSLAVGELVDEVNMAVFVNLAGALAATLAVCVVCGKRVRCSGQSRWVGVCRGGVVAVSQDHGDLQVLRAAP